MALGHAIRVVVVLVSTSVRGINVFFFFGFHDTEGDLLHYSPVWAAGDGIRGVVSIETEGSV